MVPCISFSHEYLREYLKLGTWIGTWNLGILECPDQGRVLVSIPRVEHNAPEAVRIGVFYGYD